MKRLSPKPLIHSTATTHNCTFGQYCEIMEGCRLDEVEMGDYSYCAPHTNIWCTTIGKFANIAAMARINPGNHPMERASLHHFMYRSAQYWPELADDETFFDWRRQHRVNIGHDTWLGHGAIILPGRSVGHGAVVGAGAVVTRDIAPYQIVAGNPARQIRMRFPDTIIDRLLALAWWDWSHEQVGKAVNDFRSLSVDAFLDRYDG